MTYNLTLPTAVTYLTLNTGLDRMCKTKKNTESL